VTAPEAMACDYATEVAIVDRKGGPAPAVGLHCRVHDNAWPCPHDPSKPAPARKGRRAHIVREVPPWRRLDPGAEARTECGRTIDDATVVAGTRADLIARIKAEGRGVLEGVCKVCRTKADQFRAATWGSDPGALMARDIDAWGRVAAGLNHELRALAHLAVAHEGEFFDLLRREKIHSALKGKSA
jgi:hypothetical protein